MVLNTLKEKNVLLLQVIGDLDASSCLILDDAIAAALEQNEKAIVIDCNQLQYISSAGLGVFVSYLSDFESKQVYFALMGVNDNVKNILSILGLEKLVKIIDELPSFEK
jgi:anti-sigma B factor antagonist